MEWKRLLYIIGKGCSEFPEKVHYLTGISNIRGGDIIIKIFYTVLKDVFWWNPLLHIFQQEVDNLLELRCDHAVTHNMNHQEKANYLSTILAVIKQSKQLEQQKTFTKSVMNFVGYKPYDITKQRFRVVMEKDVSLKRSKHITMFLVLIIVFIASYFIIPQPAYYPDIDKVQGIVEITRENSYIRNSEGILALYVNSEFYCFLSHDELNTLPYSELPIITED